ncbi:MAG: ABC transporter substrate-binding protein [Leptolyngbyaceae cyanobacterium CSU_1_4]|nr:ABC transporter substrate-binding protein [Leptolyngbyaceae cyanobacterium CSU_1_4]
MKLVRLALILLMLMPLGCASSPPTNPSSQATTDSTTRSAPIATRVVALTPITADIIHRMDSTKLVGIPGSQLLDQNTALQDLPRVSEGRTQPNLEKIVALEPDLVIGANGFHDQVLAKLQSLGVETLTTELNSWRSLEDLTRNLAATIQADPDPLLQSYQQCLPTQPALPETSTLVLVSRQPLLSPNEASWSGDLLTQYGVVNVVAELQGQSPIQGYVTLSPEKVLQINPNILILVNIEGENIDEFKSEPFWKDLKAVQNNKVYVLEYYGFVNAGSVEAITQACTQLQQIYGAK